MFAYLRCRDLRLESYRFLWDLNRPALVVSLRGLGSILVALVVCAGGKSAIAEVCFALPVDVPEHLIKSLVAVGESSTPLVHDRFDRHEQAFTVLELVIGQKGNGVIRNAKRFPPGSGNPDCQTNSGSDHFGEMHGAQKLMWVLEDGEECCGMVVMLQGAFPPPFIHVHVTRVNLRWLAGNSQWNRSSSPALSTFHVAGYTTT